jgi:2-oxoglutarate ferredoxin oxidoreductase subunit gamma
VEHATIFGGFGGQGLLFAGHVLAAAAVIDGRTAFWMPSYGPEMRGGTASCTVIVADHPIGSPVVDQADSVVALNRPSLLRFERLLVPGGLLIINSSLIVVDDPPLSATVDGPSHVAVASRRDIEMLAVPCSTIARSAGDDRLVSVVALGGLIARRAIVSRLAIVEALTEVLGQRHPELVDADRAAFDSGYRMAHVTKA